MNAQKSRFNQIALIILVLLYLLTVAGFTYAYWTGTQWWMVLVNILLISIPLVLLYGSIYVLLAAWQEHTTSGQVSIKIAKVIHWAPRAAAILIIFFLTLFSLDVFEMEASLLERLGGFLIHNLPSIGLLVVLVIAWNRPVVGFAAFLAAAVLFTLFFVRDSYALSNLLTFVFPLALIAVLFYADWKWLQRPKPTQDSAPN